MPVSDDGGETPDRRLVKRARREVDHAPKLRAGKRPGASRLFAPYRTVGLVSPSHVPFTSVGLGKTTFQITTSVGNALQTYDLRRGLNLVFITRPQTPSPITATLAWKDRVFASWGGPSPGVGVFRRGKQVDQLELPVDQSEDISSFRIFGSWIVGVCQTSILVWKSSTFEHYTTIQCMPGSEYTGAIAVVPTLLNKILLGKDDGSVEIWNVASGKLIYTILPDSTDTGAVTALEPAPALGMVAIGYTDGTVTIQDVCADQQVMQFFAGSDTNGSYPITSISFRTDGLGAGDDGRKPGVMATASTNSGDITMWDLNDGGRKAGVLRGAHAGPSKASPGGVGKIEFLPGQAILASSGLDNHLNTWIFDETPFSAVPRPLHSRGGHGAQVTRLHFLPSASDGSDMSGKWLLASSKDRSLWGWSLRRDGQSSELSQGAIKKKAKKSGIMSSDGRDSIEAFKAPPITSIACSLNRDGGIGALPGKQPIWQPPGQSKQQQRDAESSSMTGWESVLTAHEGDSKARTWFWGRKRAGRWAFETSDRSEVKSVAISPCGTFALVGSATGGIDCFNLQSGLHRQRFPPRLTPQQAKLLKLKLMEDGQDVDLESEPGQQKFYRGQGRHSSAVTGLAVDNLNKTLISCDSSGKIKFWDFRTGALSHQLDWSIPITALRLHRSSELIAFSCADGSIRLLDTTTHKLVRELRISKTATNTLASTPFTDFTFSQDGRWISAATSTFVCVWDLPTGHLIDLFRLPSTCTALAFSPTGEYLATATTSSVGVDIWSNLTLYTHVPTRHITESEVATILSSTPTTLPSVSGETAPLSLPDTDVPSEDDADLDLDLDPTSALSRDLLTLSLIPRSRTQTLLYLDTLRQRNKPIQPPKKPEKAPFFLPSTSGGAPQSLLSLEEQNKKVGNEETPDAAELERERSRIMKMDRGTGRGETTKLLRAAAAAEEDGKGEQSYGALVEHFKTLSPSAADVEIRSLTAGGLGGEVNEMKTFVGALCWLLRERRDFEVGQVWMSVFLRVHGEVVVRDQEVREGVREWRRLVGEEKERVGKLVEYCAGMVGFLRAGRV
ncbi:putative U3 small nucleolar RNA-associated protein 21 [Elsinoe australis]|uniref:Putative U3 small nucleolar RNA-associated protein 21 n=1 Tax=Elsinoe australis TaxID=40998 RepID=A0A4U7BD06_9PEZI|nr:putative U3 small nucleolar RNA-associated protein 21 [Elsinoe australis]